VRLAVDLGDFLVKQLVTLLADLDNLLSLQTQSYTRTVSLRDSKTRGRHTAHSLENLVGDLGGGLVLGQGVRVVEGVV
jgi:hypothetical protein